VSIKDIRVWVLIGLPLLVAAFSAAIYPDQRAAISVVVVAVMSVGFIVAIAWRTLWSARRDRAIAALLRARRSAVRRPGDLEEMERAFGWQVYTVPEFNHRLRPILRSVLRSRLRWRRGIDIDLSPERSVEALPPRLSELVAPTRARSEDERVTTQDLVDLVGELERI
jgi:hypothetical protein